MCDKKGEMVFAPGPARESGNGKVDPEQDEPEIKPWRAINVGAGDFRIETRFINRSGDCGDDQDRKQNNREFERSKKFENRIALPRGLLDRTRICHEKINTFREVKRRINSRKLSESMVEFCGTAYGRAESLTGG